MALLRTRRLSAHKQASSGSVDYIYQVPPSSRGIIRDVQVFNPGGGPNNLVQLFIRLSGGSVTFPVFSADVPANGVSRVSCDVVLEAGDELGAYSGTAGTSYYVSGAEMPIIPA